MAPLRFLDADLANAHNEFVDRTEDEWERRIRPKLSETKMSVDVSEVPLERILELIAERAELSLVWAQGAEKSKAQRANLNVTGMPVAQILDSLTSQAGLDWGLESEAIVISPR